MTVPKLEFRRYACIPGGYAPLFRVVVEVGTVAGAATMHRSTFRSDCRE
jgi:hypothetical protein